MITSYFALHITLSRGTNIDEAATKDANKPVKRVLEQEREAGQRKKGKVYGSYTDTKRAAIGKYAAENGNIAAKRHFKSKLRAYG